MGLAGRFEAYAARGARRWQARSFASRLRVDSAGPVVVLSPHLDDAVVDAWSVLTADADVTVVNVFTGLPPDGTLAHWDRLCGATDSAALMRERLAEDAGALAHAGRVPVALGFRADPYRRPLHTPSLRALDDALAGAVGAASRVLAPAALGTVHPDHLLVREHAMAIAAAGVPVELYADQPYAVLYGWPAWVTGAPADARLDPEVYWRAGRADLPELLTRERARVIALDGDAAARKLEAMRAYRTQFPMLDRGPIGLLSNPRIHRHEVFWPVGR